MADAEELGQRFDALSKRLDGLLGPSEPVEYPPSLAEDMAAFRAALDAQAGPPDKRSPVDKVMKGFGGLWRALMHPRHPKGSPEGGKFAPKDGPAAGVKWTPAGGEDMKPLPGFNGGHGRDPKARPPSAIKHHAVDDKGDEVWIDYPSKPSPSAVWDDPESTATFTPMGAAPASLNGVKMEPWRDAPRTKEGWANVSGQNPDVEAGMPPLEAPKGKTVGAGVIIEEPDGRVWIVSPTNGFGGYRQTFPKGTAEDGIPSLQANAIKEAYEESGLRIEITGVVGDFARTTSVARFYTARRVGGSPVAMGWESQAARLAPMGQLRKWLNRGDVDHPIVDAYERLRGIRKAKGGMRSPKKPTGPVAPSAGGSGFDASKHPRYPVGHPKAGEFMPKAGGDAGGSGGGSKGGALPEPPKIGWKKDGSAVGANATYWNKMDAAYQAALKGDYGPVQKLLDDNAVHWQAMIKGEPQNSHGKWKAQMAQWADGVLAHKEGLQAAAVKASVVEAKLGPPSIANWTQVGAKPGGSAPGALYTDEDGVKWLVKGNLQGKDDNRAKNEVLAAKLLQASGLPAPEYKLVDLGDKFGGGLGVATRWEDGLKPLKDKADDLQAKSQFAVHAWMGNWDAVGLSKDNMLVRKNGDVVNIDPGGSLLYRAQGTKKKPGEFGEVPTDWTSMRKPSNSAAQVFGDMTDSQLKDSAKRLQGISDDTIESLVKAHGPGNASEQNLLIDTLIARRDAILAWNGHGKAKASAEIEPIKPKPMPAPVDDDPAAAGVKAEAEGPNGFKPQLSQTDVEQPLAVAWQPAKNAVAELSDPKGLYAGKPNPEAAKTLAVVENAWMAQAVDESDDGKGWDALNVAAYAANLKAYHEGKFDPVTNSHAAMLQEKGMTAYADQMAFLDAADKYATPDLLKALDDGPGIVPEGKTVAIPSSVESMMTDVKSKADAEDYAEWAIEQANNGIKPPPPKIADPDFDNAASAMQDMVRNGEVDFLLQGGGWSTFGVGGTAFNGYAKALGTYHVGKGASAEPQPKVLSFVYENEPATTSAPKPKPSGAMPDFSSYLKPPENTNAASHNKKVNLIEKLANDGDADGIAGMFYGTNTYGKMQAKLANDVLAALGSTKTVTIGKAAAAGAPSVAPKKVTITKADLPPKPNFANFKGPGQAYSSKPWKNEANQKAVDEIEAKALTGDLEGLKNLKYKETKDDAEGTLTGLEKPYALHPSKPIQQYWSDATQAVDDKFNPPVPILPFNSVKAKSIADIDKAFPPTPLLTTVAKMPQNQKVGFWMALGNTTAAPETMVPKVKPFDLSNQSFKAKMKEAYAKTSKTTRDFIDRVQASGAINEAYNEGLTSYAGMDLKQVSQALHDDAIELPEGGTAYKWLKVPHNMQEALSKAAVGTVLQNPGSACVSMHATKTQKFAGTDPGTRARVVYRAAKGAKMVPTWGKPGHNGFADEEEVTALPGARMVLLGTRKMTAPGLAPWFEIEVTLLPPHKNSTITKL